MTQEKYEELLSEQLTRLRACSMLVAEEDVRIIFGDIVSNLEKLLGLQAPSDQVLMERVREIIALEDMFESGNEEYKDEAIAS